MKVIDINQHRLELEEALNIALDTPDYVLELHEINMAIEEGEEWLEYVRQALYPPLRCISGGDNNLSGFRDKQGVEKGLQTTVRIREPPQGREW
jgi:hypothetical protein